MKCKCGTDYAVPSGEADTGLCNACAHQEVERLRAAIATPEVYAGVVTEVVERERDKAVEKVAYLQTWDGLMETLDMHWPADVFPGKSRDPGARVVALLRLVGQQRETMKVHERIIERLHRRLEQGGRVR